MSWFVKFVWFVCIQVEGKFFINQNLALIFGLSAMILCDNFW
jgi:hypothetical protein